MQNLLMLTLRLILLIYNDELIFELNLYHALLKLLKDYYLTSMHDSVSNL